MKVAQNQDMKQHQNLFEILVAALTLSRTVSTCHIYMTQEILLFFIPIKQKLSRKIVNYLQSSKTIEQLRNERERE